MASDKGESVTVQSDSDGKIFTVIDSAGHLHRGTVVIKAVYCGKHCKKCPHGFYKYVVWRQDGKTRWKYVGKTTKGAVCAPEQKNF
jgi:hypothetical protein